MIVFFTKLWAGKQKSLLKPKSTFTYQLKKQYRKYHFTCGCLNLILAFLLGFFYISVQATLQLAKTLPVALQATPITIVGTIVSLPEVDKEDTWCFDFDIQQTLPRSLWQNPGRVRLRWEEPPKILYPGDVYQLTVKLKPPRSYSNPGSFDKEKQFFLNHWVGSGNVSDKSNALYLENRRFAGWVDRLRYSIRKQMQKYLENQPLCGPIIALVVGAKEGIQPDQWQIFQETGTSHLMAISGLHVGLMASVAFCIIHFIWRRLPDIFLKIPCQWSAAIAALISTVVYALLAGFSVPTQRAMIMVLITMAGIILRRKISVGRSFFVALGVLLLMDPFATLSPGFWLSFGAVGIILYGMNNRLSPRGLWYRFGRPQFLVFLGLMPYTFSVFGQISLIAPVANLFAIPILSFLVVPLAIFGALIAAVSPSLGAFLLRSAESILGLLWMLLEYLKKLPFATWNRAECSFFSLCCAMMGMFWLLSPRGLPGRYLGIIFILPLFLNIADKVEEGTARVTVLDVGQGLSTVVETKNHVLVYDTGPKFNAQFDTGDRVVIPYLKTRGRKKIDTLIISHGDNDHVGGMASILKKMPVQELMSSEDLPVDKPVIYCFPGQTWQWDGVTFEILHPETMITQKRNDHSCVLQVRAGHQSILLTGDIESKSEHKILARYGKQLQSTVLLVPHHGSSTSSALDFIQGVNPEYAIIPVGKYNSYGHPKPEVLARYRDQGIKLYDSVRHGAITFFLRKSDSLLDPPRCYRLDNLRYWQTREVSNVSTEF